MSILRKGLVIKHRLKKRKGVVIDCGTVINWDMIGASGARNRKYIISKEEQADAVRVWTVRGIEVWCFSDVAAEGIEVPCRI